MLWQPCKYWSVSNYVCYCDVVAAYAPTTTNQNNQNIIYSNMSNHYRLLLNAKKRVDTSPPVTFRPNGNRSPHRAKNRRPHADSDNGSNVEGLTPSDLVLIEQVAQNDMPIDQPIRYWYVCYVQSVYIVLGGGGVFEAR